MHSEQWYREQEHQSQQAVTQSAGRLWADLWPDDSTPRNRPQSRIMLGELPPGEVRIPAVTSADNVTAGDLVVLVELGNSGPAFDVLGVLTAKEVMKTSPKVAKVLSTAAKSLVLVMIPTPHDGWECDLEGFAERSYDPTEVRLTISTKTRQIGRLGTAAEVRAKIANHPQFDEWAQAYQHAKTIERESRDAAVQRAVEQERREQTLLSVAELLKDAVGSHVFVDDQWGRGVMTTTEYRFFLQPPDLRIYLAGLRALGKLDDERYALVQEQLKSVGLLR